VADQQQQRALRRFLENLEQRIGAFALQIVDRVDNGDAPAALARGRAEERHRAAHVVDANYGVKLAGLLVDRAFEHEKIALCLRGDAAGDRVVGIDRERCCLLHHGRLRIRMSQHEPRQAVSQGRLADAGRPADQPGMRDAPALITVEQRLLGLGMGEQRQRCARD